MINLHPHLIRCDSSNPHWDIDSIPPVSTISASLAAIAMEAFITFIIPDEHTISIAYPFAKLNIILKKTLQCPCCESSVTTSTLTSDRNLGFHLNYQEKLKLTYNSFGCCFPSTHCTIKETRPAICYFCSSFFILGNADHRFAHQDFIP